MESSWCALEPIANAIFIQLILRYEENVDTDHVLDRRADGVDRNPWTASTCWFQWKFGNESYFVGQGFNNLLIFHSFYSNLQVDIYLDDEGNQKVPVPKWQKSPNQ